MSGSLGVVLYWVINGVAYLIISIQNFNLPHVFAAKPQCSAGYISSFAQEKFNLKNLSVATVQDDGVTKTFQVVSGDNLNDAYLIVVHASTCRILSMENSKI